MTHHPFHQTKFRWTENLTSRFIQLRKENGNLFTGRKYSAQAGWEHILQQMRREFPTIMADVHYRVLKKKWSNLLQQYKELKNPVHGDRNKSDDVSWPFYGAIDEVLGFGSANRRNEDPDFDSVNPHEFLCLSVTPEEPASPPDDVKNRQECEIDIESNSVIALHQRIRNLRKDFSIEIEKLPETMTTTTATTTTTRRLLGHRSSGQSRIADVMNCQDASEALVSRLPLATELSIKTVRTSSSVPSIRVKDFSKDLRNSPPDLSPISAPNTGRFLRDVLAVVKENGIHNSSSVIEDLEEVEEEVEEEEEEEEEDDDDGAAEEEEEDDDDGEEEESKKLHKLNEVRVEGREEEEIEEIEEEEEELEEEDDDEADDEVLLDEEVRIRPRKIRRIERLPPPLPPPPPISVTERERGLERRLDEFIEYTKRRDEENYRIMTRILNAVEKIADKQ